MEYTGNAFGVIEQGIIDVEMAYTEKFRYKHLKLTNASVSKCNIH